MESFHILIIWSKAIDKKDFIINDLKGHFKIRKIFQVHWDKDLFINNLKCFYAHSQKHLNRYEYTELLRGKINTCGDSDFIAIIFKDSNPLYEDRTTSSGISLVNKNVFDRKMEYRNLSGNRYDIHASNDAWETNKDLTILFGLNTSDFCKKYPVDDDIIENYSSNAIGVNGFQSINQLFYLLNNTIKYCILRNFECLPSQYTIEGHGDIDLLVENKNYISYLTQAKSIFSESYRVYNTIRINNEDVPFDFRHVGDNYYDTLWEKNILNSRNSRENFYIPDDENLYYTLLYHAYVQKGAVKQDYLPKLKQYANNIGKEFSDDINMVMSDLDSYLKQYGYEYVKPTDKTVFFNLENLSFSNHANRYGCFISRNEVDCNGAHYSTKIYKRNNTFFKVATKEIIDKEYQFLKRLESELYFPKVVDYGEIDTKSNYIEITACEGESPISFFEIPAHQHLHYIKSFVEETLKAISVLINHNIIHRDILPQNILVTEKKGKCSISIIDFGWSANIGDKNTVTPQQLGGWYHDSNGYSDVYSLGVIINDIEKYHGTRYECRTSNLLKQIISIDYNDIQLLTRKIAQLQKHLSPTFLDQLSEWKFFIKNHYHRELLFSLLPFRVAYECRNLCRRIFARR